MDAKIRIILQKELAHASIESLISNVILNSSRRNMNKNTSIMMVAALAGIMVAGALALVVPVQVKADQFAGNGGIGGAGGAGGVGGNGGSNSNAQASGDDSDNHQSANGGSANGGNGGSANGGNICNAGHSGGIGNHVRHSEVCGSS